MKMTKLETFHIQPRWLFLKIHTDAAIYLAQLNENGSVDFTITPGRYVWLQVLSGSVSVNGIVLSQSDGVAVSGEDSLTITGTQDSEVMLFDLA
jgi:redox-sensitive bicupin YhaK (pirin superfamily)